MSFSKAEQKRLKDKYGRWAVVTGASSGIGKELALRLAEAGLSLILVARRQAALEALQKTMAEQYGTESELVAADLSTPEGVEQVIASSNKVSVGLLVASAGFGTSGPFIDNALAVERNMLAVNCDALLHLSHHFGQRFAQQGKGGLILLSSMVAFQGAPFSANYAATKAYVQALAEGLYHELRPLGVDVLAAAPGPVRTGFGERATMNMAQALTPEQVGIPILKALGRRMTVVPGSLSKFLTYSLHTMPRSGRVWAMGSIMKGMHDPTK